MKKYLMIILSATLLLTSCGGTQSVTEVQEEIKEEVKEETTEVVTEETITEAVEELQEEVQEEINEIAESYEVQAVTKSLDGLCEYLLEKGVISGDQTLMAGDMLGAVSGVKYKDSSVELYEYDIESDAYKGLEETGKVTLQGFNYEVTPNVIKEGYILLSDNEDVINAFNEYFN